MGIERVGLEHHGDAAVGRFKVRDIAAGDRDSSLPFRLRSPKRSSDELEGSKKRWDGWNAQAVPKPKSLTDVAKNIERKYPISSRHTGEVVNVDGGLHLRRFP
jgi:hypothetical protein